MSRLKTGLKRPREVPVYLSDLEREYAIRQMHDFKMKSLTEYFRLARIPDGYDDMMTNLTYIRKKQKGMRIPGLDAPAAKSKRGGFNG